MSFMSQSDSGRSWNVGYFQASSMPLTAEREPEVGIAWMVCCKDLGLCALGDTIEAAGKHLLEMINKRGISGHGALWPENVPEEKR
jgi:hypothetical protein